MGSSEVGASTVAAFQPKVVTMANVFNCYPPTIKTYYLHPKTEVTGAPNVSTIWDLHYQNCFVVGPGCNRTIGVLGFTKKKDSIQRMGLSTKFDPSKGSFRGCSGSHSCAEQKQIWLGGDAWVSGGVDCARIQAMVPSSLLQ